MPNPIDNPSYFTKVLIGGRATPGNLVNITGLASAEEWVKQNGISNIEALVWRRRPLVKGIHVFCGLNGEDDDQVREFFAAWYEYIKYLKPGGNPQAKPPAMAVVNTQFMGAFVKQVVYAGHTEPIWRLNEPVIGEIVLDEYRKPVAITVGPPEAAITSDTNPSPRTSQEARAAYWANQAAAKNK